MGQETGRTMSSVVAQLRVSERDFEDAEWLNYGRLDLRLASGPPDV